MADSLTHATRDAYLQRLQRIPPDARPRFGTLDPTRLMAHLQCTFVISMGQQEIEFVGNRFTTTRFMKWFVIDAPIPWPKGRIKAPDAFTPAPTDDFHAERDRLVQSIHQFVEQADAQPDAIAGASPILGPLPYHRWRKLHGRHLDHHFQQFGV